jgi:small membrane protein
MIIQVVLLAAILGLLFVFVRNRHSVRMQAGKRIGLVAFALVNVYAVVRPNDITVVANWFGVGRGTDLLLYGLVLAFLLGMLNYYLRFQGVDRQLTELARTLAIREAEIVNGERGLLPGSDAVATAVTPVQPEQPPTGTP